MSLNLFLILQVVCNELVKDHVLRGCELATCGGDLTKNLISRRSSPKSYVPDIG